ncbi:MAG TPA: glycosyltransferase family 9 protein [Ktedonosporobacter sp.]|jgi:ADP-heptose:LPS heptosyltransferase|nr:glycosyltransferase family 9 protein [Ktedonosporobacter sp.]
MNDPFTPGLLTRLEESPRKIALLRASRIGDFLCATPALRALRLALPDAAITLITLPMLREIAQRLPYVDHVVEFPGYPGIAEQLFDARRATHFLCEMQGEQFDLAIQMQGTGVNSNPFMLLLGARTTAGFVRPGEGAGLLDAALPYPEHLHEVRCVLALTSFLGVPDQGEDILFPLHAEDLQQAERLLKDAAPPLIGLHPSARDEARRWSPDRFAATCSTLLQQYGGTVILVGEGQERELGEVIARQIDGPCCNLMGQTSLLTLGGVLARLAVLLTNDSGPAHIAYALGTPTVTIFGASSPILNGPLHTGPFRAVIHEVPCRPCGYAVCPIGNPCLQGVSVEQVVEAAKGVISLR